MRELSHLQKPVGSTKSPKRVARGNSGKGGQRAGRGNKGQKSRSGVNMKPGFEGGQMPLIRRIPKRGFKSLNRLEYAIVNVAKLNIFPNDTIVNPELLFQKGLIKKQNQPVKILGNGDLQKNLKVIAHKFSKSAVDKIKKNGGTIEVITKQGNGNKE